MKAVEKADLKLFDGFVSNEMVLVEVGVAETPVTVLRDTASGQPVMVADTFHLPETAALKTFAY